MNCPVKEIFYGGARGGGKTDGMIGKNAIKASIYGKDQKGVFFRKELPQLEAAIDRCKQIYLPLGWKWAEQKKTFTSPGGSTLKFRMLERDADAEKYQGQDFTDVYMEELTNYASPTPINRLRATLRSAVGIPCQLHGTGNPGGPGHHWVKERYIDPNPAGLEILEEELPNGATHKRIFIPAKLDDNLKLMELDPDYENNLYMSGSEALVKAWRWGDWNVVEGAFFDCWHRRMVHKPFLVPADWTKLVSFDWGSSKPFSVQWWAVVADDYTTSEGVLLPRGYLLCYREWYGAKAPDVGLKLTAEAVGLGIKQRTTEKINDWVADPAIFKEDGGPSQAERMGLPFRGADNTRVGRLGHMGGWDQMRSRMVGTRTFDDNGVIRDDGVPMMGYFNTCKASIRTIPSLQHDPNKAEDLNTNSEDHAADSARYACMSRPWREKRRTAEIIHVDVWGRPKQTNHSWKTA
ncbi:MAG: terminase family protein [Bacteroidales bacterium]|nr:terminase family protein [Candidatus Latescibacterota bacterium]